MLICVLSFIADIYGLLQALEGIGLKLRTDVPFDVSLLAKFFFRDAKPQAEAQNESKQRREEYKQKEELKLKSLYVGDKVDVTTRNSLGWRKTRKGEIIRIGNDNANDNNQHNDENANHDDFLTIRTTNGKEILTQRRYVKLQKSRSPIDAWPDAFIFFERVLGLLRGLTASLNVNQSYLEVMTPFARLALMRYSHHKEQQQQQKLQGENSSSDPSSSSLSMSEFDEQLVALSPSSSSLTAATAAIKGHDSLSIITPTSGDSTGGNTTSSIRELLQELIASGDVLGCQVVVIKVRKRSIEF